MSKSPKVRHISIELHQSSPGGSGYTVKHDTGESHAFKTHGEVMEHIHAHTQNHDNLSKADGVDNSSGCVYCSGGSNPNMDGGGDSMEKKTPAKTTKHPGFKRVQNKIATKEGLSEKAAGAILAARSRSASPAAKKANPNLNKVK